MVPKSELDELRDVRPITEPKRPIRKCPKCGIRTSLLTCPSINCSNTKTVIVTDEGRL